MSKVHTALWTLCLCVITTVMLVICVCVSVVVQSIRTDAQIHHHDSQLLIHLPNITQKLDYSNILFIIAAKEWYQPPLSMIKQSLPISFLRCVDIIRIIII